MKFKIQASIFFGTFVALVAISSTMAIGSLVGSEDPLETRITLRSGNQLAGEVISELKEEGRSYVVFKTRSGSVLKLDKGKMIQRMVAVGPENREYESRLQAMQQTVDEHWSMYEWCRDKSRRSKLKKEAIFHLRQIVKLDPSDSKAWRSFKLVDPDRAFVLVDNQWIAEQQHYRSIGYVKTNGHWIPEIQAERKRTAEAQDEFRNSRKVALKRWKKNTLPTASVADVRAELLKIVDPVSVNYVAKNLLKREKNPQLRALYLEAIGQVASPSAHKILVQYLMTDEHPDVREQAILMLEQEKHFDKDRTVFLLSLFLKSPENFYVERAGRLIGRMNRLSGVTSLIEALITQHKVETGNEPGRTNAGVGSNGNAGLSMGGDKTVTLPFKNEEVLAALEKITGQRANSEQAFDQDSWRRWYVSEYTVTNVDLRRGLDD